ncbi:MAG: radical SAM/SPASM domain-containing protein [Candidatus Tectomicrobia bacterium]|uniref:Radical SAM/SPASM domain-containing protein n=1 Tax=Tectimicrobiota bacterium TaxID=2528274 RepID=A0A937W7Q6_UNCTE|nr:radical SAM/SPASM domain-containing protein [Candidatus Tectomicrobia bacterium]
MSTYIQPADATAGEVLTPDAVPLFTRIQIQAVSWCNRSCAFCPSGKFPVEKVFMPVDIYHRLIHQLAAVQYDGRISPYLMNESLLDKRLPDLIAYTRAHCPESWISINTNGDALSEALLARLFDAGLNSLDVNAYDSPAQHAEHVALAQRFASGRSEIQLRTTYSNPLFQGTGIPRHTRLLNCRDMSFWEPRFLAKIATPDLQNRSGHIPGSRQIIEPLRLGCQRPSQQMYVNYRGEAILCCNDWRSEVIMGDTAQATLADIWVNHKYQAYRRHLQQKNRAMPLCNTCDYMAEPADWE